MNQSLSTKLVAHSPRTPKPGQKAKSRKGKPPAIIHDNLDDRDPLDDPADDKGWGHINNCSERVPYPFDLESIRSSPDDISTTAPDAAGNIDTDAVVHQQSQRFRDYGANSIEKIDSTKPEICNLNEGVVTDSIEPDNNEQAISCTAGEAVMSHQDPLSVSQSISTKDQECSNVSGSTLKRKHTTITRDNEIPPTELVDLTSDAEPAHTPPVSKRRKTHASPATDARQTPNHLSSPTDGSSNDGRNARLADREGSQLTSHIHSQAGQPTLNKPSPAHNPEAELWPQTDIRDGNLMFTPEPPSTSSSCPRHPSRDEEAHFHSSRANILRGRSRGAKKPNIPEDGSSATPTCEVIASGQLSVPLDAPVVYFVIPCSKMTMPLQPASITREKNFKVLQMTKVSDFHVVLGYKSESS
ncbi:hypothetical protein BU24DRAFT_448616 [Aaosphaeria arxii CBS 175.79]|uniref:Uncharacterized protein n=1 Tax=Aaosphaeria arxii CBS 175.79 TaxID=1450172 RepID=A0A6A5Y444_9PLEO|nr:uncharacterized protein BU24DRAFT_448616 [Aaosphaeria arxii CBS 175.79]KAF2020322.1 hypothetical protein BU24DRAFT_448616 [Aaosphaeria arxii CBS 175.79]